MSERLAFRGVLVKPLADQHDRTNEFLDPDTLRFNPDLDYPVHVEFDYDKPAGTARLHRAEDGSIVVEGELRLGTHPSQLAFGGAVGKVTRTPDSAIYRDAEVMSIGLTDQHADPTQPVISCRIVKR